MARTKAALIKALATFNITATSGTADISPLTGSEKIAELEAILARAEEANTQGPNPVVPAAPYVVKEYVQNGLKYRRMQKEDGSTVDVRI